MITSDYSLSFLNDINAESSEDRIQDAWRDRVFPLVLIDDFAANWGAVQDPGGIFLDETGRRYRVEPQDHFVPQCRVHLQKEGKPDEGLIRYEAIILSKVAYRLFLNAGEELPTQPPVVRRRVFIERYISKFPPEWRDVVIQYDLHLFSKAHPERHLGEDLYRPLSHPKAMRLVSLLPSSRTHSQVKCTLVEESLDPCPAYEALSYSWGDASSTRPILVNGKTLRVTESLECALRELRHKDDTPRVMWIDSICIDQSNPAEKEEQVLQMDKIYSNAQRVLVWLGRESNASSVVFTLLHAIRRQIEGALQRAGLLEQNASLESILVRAGATEGPQTPSAQPSVLVDIGIPWQRIHEQSLDSFVALMQRPWWRRVWVIQEVALAREVVLCCGSKTVDWSFFRFVLFMMIKFGHQTYITRGASNRRQVNTIISLTIDTIKSYPFMLLACVEEQVRQSLTLAKLFTLTRAFHATDPHDHVYALLGLLAEDSPDRRGILPNYSLPARQLFIRTAQHFIASTHTLDLLSICTSIRNPSPTSSTDPVLPTWVPSWTTTTTAAPSSGGSGADISLSRFSPHAVLSAYAINVASLPQRRAVVAASTPSALYRAGLDPTTITTPFPIATFSPCGEILSARGIRVAVVEEVGAPMALHAVPPGAQRETLHAATLAQWKLVCRVPGADDTAAPADHTAADAYPLSQRGHSLTEAFWRAVLLDRLPGEGGGRGAVARLPPTARDAEQALFFSADVGAPVAFPPGEEEGEAFVRAFARGEYRNGGGGEGGAGGGGGGAPAGFSWHGEGLVCFRGRGNREEEGEGRVVGVAPLGVKEGDEIAVLVGAAVPVVLREVDEGRWVVVGESYVHGVMDGEVIENERQQGRGKNLEDYEEFQII